MKVTPSHFSSCLRIRPPLVGAQEPFSISATLRFEMLCATRSEISASIVTKMPALYVVEAKTRWLQRKAAAMISDAGVTETSNITVSTPRSRRRLERISAAIAVLPYTEAYAIMTPFFSGL